jgi:ribosomal protein L7/L12
LTIRCPYCHNSVIVPDELRPESQKATENPSYQVLSADMDLGSLIGQAVGFKEVVELARSGKKIEAIKRYRQLTGLGLKESKDAVDALVAGQPITVTTGSVTGLLSEQEDQAAFAEKSAALSQVAQLVKEDKKIEAIKLFRETFDTSLVEAKTAVEKIEAGEYQLVHDRMLQSPYTPLVIPPKVVQATTVAAGAAAAGGISCFVWLIVLVVILSVLVPVLIALASRGGPLAGLWMQVNPASFARLTTSFGGEGTGPGLFSDPRSIAVDGEGSIYVADYSDGRIQRFSAAGEYQSLWNIGDESYVTGFTASRDGTVYIVFQGKIQRYEGTTGAQLGPIESAEDHYIDDVVLAPDSKLVAISRGETILRFDGQGALDLTIPAAISTVSGDSELDARLAVDGLGNIYALGTFNNAVFKFSPEGKFITRFGSDGDEPGQFRAPSAIAVDGKGRVYVSDFKGIQVFDSEGRYLDKIDGEGFVFGLWIANNNQLFAVSNQPKVYIYNLPE